MYTAILLSELQNFCQNSSSIKSQFETEKNMSEFLIGLIVI